MTIRVIRAVQGLELLVLHRLLHVFQSCEELDADERRFGVREDIGSCPTIGDRKGVLVIEERNDFEPLGTFIRKVDCCMIIYRMVIVNTFPIHLLGGSLPGVSMGSKKIRKTHRRIN